MGNQNTKHNKNSAFTQDELKVIEAAYRAVCTHDKCTKENLMNSWMAIIDHHLVKCTVNYLFMDGQRIVPTISLQRFGEPYYILNRGTIDDKLKFLIGSLENNTSGQFAVKQLELYIAAVLRTYLELHDEQKCEIFESWQKYGYQSSERSIFAFAKGLTRSVLQISEHRVDFDKLDQWLQHNPTFIVMWKEVFAFLYSKNAGKMNKLCTNSITAHHILPGNEGILDGCNYIPILDIPHVIFANSNLPNNINYKWRLLFCSVSMGQSFSTMLAKISNKGPTLILVEDEDRHIFGGYAPHSWSLKPTFVGDDSSVLLTLSPAMKCFSSSGYNDHYQYLNLNQQTMPNGLGMGGQFNFWGLWLDCDYGSGQSSESCSTYRSYVQLSKRKDFKIQKLEVWGIGDEVLSDEDEEDNNKPSVLDSHLTDRAILQISGKRMFSDGLREEPEEHLQKMDEQHK